MITNKPLIREEKKNQLK